MAKVNQDPFSNGEEYRWWTERNCGKCIKSPILNYVTGELDRKPRCSIWREIDDRMFVDRPISKRTIDVCRMNDCPFRKENYPIRHRRRKVCKDVPVLF